MLWPYKIFKPEYRDTFRLFFTFYSGLPHIQAVAKSEWANFFPVQSSNLAALFAARKKAFKRRSGIITQVTPPDNNGYVNLGLDAFYTEDILNLCEWAIAVVNPQLPRTCGETNLHVSRFTAFVEDSFKVPAIPALQATDVEVKMAQNVMELLHDRDCLQVGIGGVPAMISTLLADANVKDLGIHSEMVPYGTATLVEKGIITGKYKKTNPGKIVVSFAMGDKPSYDFLENNETILFRQTSYSCDPCEISKEDNVVAINGSIEVDLTGQIVSDSIGTRMRSGVGGQLDFVIGANWSKGGRPINLVPSTSNNDTISRIVPFIGNGTRVTVPRHFAGIIVTEYGAVDLRPLSEPERAKALIKIAHPKFRDELEKAGRERGLLNKSIF
jgi:acyl-CoA hydrolase